MNSYNISSDIVITSQSFGLLRKTLIENMGVDRAKKILNQFGQELGAARGVELLKSNMSFEKLKDAIPLEHVNLGHVSAITSDGLIYWDENEKIIIENLSGIWRDSFEVHSHKAFLGEATECSCYTLSGFASGILSTIFNEEIIVREITCQSKGDENCSFQVKTKKEWIEDGFEFNDQTILNEIEDTYDKLLEKNILFNKVTNYHKKLTECVAGQNDIQQVLETAFSIIQTPVFISDQLGKFMLHEGLNERNLKYVRSHPLKLKNLTKTELFKKENYYILTTPIYVENQLIATCSFLYVTDEIDSNDYLYLERLASVSSLCFLNEKIKFETAERLKISFLDRLIYQQFKNSTERVNQAKYIKPPLSNNFITLAIKNNVKQERNVPIDIYNQVLQIAKLLQLYHVNGLVTQKGNHIIIFIYSITDFSIFKSKLDSILNELSNQYKSIDFSIGMSNLFSQLEGFIQSIIQAEQAMNTPRKNALISYSDLGLLGAILQNLDKDQIIKVAQKELKELLNEDPKSKELLYTLFIYLKNSGKLEKTTQELSLSLGGVQYRIRRIEDIIEKDLKNAANTSYLFLLLESLTIIGEIDF